MQVDGSMHMILCQVTGYTCHCLLCKSKLCQWLRNMVTLQSLAREKANTIRLSKITTIKCTHCVAKYDDIHTTPEQKVREYGKIIHNSLDLSSV